MPQPDPEDPGSTPPPHAEPDLLAHHLDEVMRVIRGVCVRAHLGGVEAEDFTSVVLLKLADNSQAVLRAFEERSSLNTYLKIVVERLLLDFRAQNWGKWRPSAEATRCGTVAVLLEQLLVRDGHTFGEACELLASRHNVSMPRADIEALAGRLPVRSRRRFEPDDALQQVRSPAPQPDANVLEQERAQSARLVAAELQKCLLRLDPTDRLIINLRFTDGRLVSHIARALSLDQTQLYRRIDRILKGLRKDLEAAGFPADLVRQVWGSHGFDAGE
ncbi:MAG: sigma-70 family RNA polymerase sigma factor [Vicinamibacterales bacterium]